MSVSDALYANGWLYSNEEKIHTITPIALTDASSNVATIGNYYADVGDACSNKNTIFPSVYLKPEIKVISGNGDDKPYILGL